MSGLLSDDSIVQMRGLRITDKRYGESRTDRAADGFPLVNTSVGELLAKTSALWGPAHWSGMLRLHYDPCATYGH